MTWLREIDQWLIGSVLPHEHSLRRAAARMVGPEEANDLVQDAYARLLTYPAWRDIAHPKAFALQIVRNLALERLRRATVVPIDRIASLDGFDVADEAPDAFREVAGRVDVERLLVLVDNLPPQCARVVRLRKIEGLSPREIAVSLGISVSTVETHLAKGLARLTEQMHDTTVKGAGWPKSWTRRRARR